MLLIEKPQRCQRPGALIEEARRRTRKRRARIAAVLLAVALGAAIVIDLGGAAAAARAVLRTYSQRAREVVARLLAV